MFRLIVHQSRSIHLEWIEPEKAYIFRLMYGGTFLTPKLRMYPVEWWGLAEEYPVSLRDQMGELWVVLQRKDHFVDITPRKPLVYVPAGTPPVPAEWPPIPYQEMFIQATKERGIRPDAGVKKGCRRTSGRIVPRAEDET